MFYSRSYERCEKVQEEWKVEPEVHWTLWDLRASVVKFLTDLLCLPVRPVFHLSMRRKDARDDSDVISASAIQMKQNLSYELDKQVHKLRSKELPFWWMCCGGTISMRRQLGRSRWTCRANISDLVETSCTLSYFVRNKSISGGKCTNPTLNI